MSIDDTDDDSDDDTDDDSDDDTDDGWISDDEMTDCESDDLPKVGEYIAFKAYNWVLSFYIGMVSKVRGKRNEENPDTNASITLQILSFDQTGEEKERHPRFAKYQFSWLARRNGHEKLADEQPEFHKKFNRTIKARDVLTLDVKLLLDGSICPNDQKVIQRGLDEM